MTKLTKVCPRCGKSKPLSSFRLRSIKAKTIYPFCRPCETSYRFASPTAYWRIQNLPSARYRARKKGIPFTITSEHVANLAEAQDNLCALTNFPLTYGPPRCPTNASLDRICTNPTVGYIPSNVRIVCVRANIMRLSMSDDELHIWCQHICDNKQ